jgi:hypothetical protein
VTALAGMTTLRAGESGATRAAVSAQRTSELSTPGTTDAYTPRMTPDEAKTLVETATDTETEQAATLLVAMSIHDPRALLSLLCNRMDTESQIALGELLIWDAKGGVRQG